MVPTAPRIALTARIFILVLVLCVPSCGGADSTEQTGTTWEITGSAGSTLKARAVTDFNEPWAMVFLPGGDMLVTEKPGALLLVSKDGRTKKPVRGVPEVAYGGQGGLGDVILHPQFSSNNLIYLSYAEAGDQGTKGAAVAQARLNQDSAQPTLTDLQVIWRQEPKVSGSGHYSHRLAFGPDKKLFITSGDRQKQAPAQEWNNNLGKVIRVNADGTVPPDNPFQDKGELARSFWSIGHRNLLGIAFDKQGRLWTHEMGPRHGDEFNLIVPGDNYGWPIVSWGDQYSGIPIPDHDTRPEFNGPECYWVPTIAPSGLIIYDGNLFPEWRGNAFIGGLASQALLRITITEDNAEEVERFPMEKRIREVEQGPDGAIWVLEDKKGGRLLVLTP
jgi:aldose sugar dehydrogenase